MLNNSGKEEEIKYVYTAIKLRERKKVRKIQFDFTIYDKREEEEQSDKKKKRKKKTIKKKRSWIKKRGGR